MTLRHFPTIVGTLALLLVAGCSSYSESGGDPKTQSHQRQTLSEEVKTTIDVLKQKDPSLNKFFDTAYGYAIFPTVGKGGIGLGGAFGRGEVYEKGVLVGYTSVAQGTIGLQLGGQAYSEVIFFQDKARMDHFKAGQMEFAAQASAVAATAGAAANADYSGGVAVFTLPRGGLMYEASIGGQKFSYTPK